MAIATAPITALNKGYTDKLPRIVASAKWDKASQTKCGLISMHSRKIAQCPTGKLSDKEIILQNELVD